MEREKLGSRLGFILLSAGCAIGIGNVWKFPYMAGQYGGGAFVVIYLFFLLILGIPIMSMEFAVGRGSQSSPVRMYHKLEKPGTKWHLMGPLCLIGNFILMMFYTTVAGWMLYYLYASAAGTYVGMNADEVGGLFGSMLESPGIVAGCMIITVAAGFLILSLGLQNGLERVTKVMMLLLMVLIIILAVHSITLKGGAEGLVFYLRPDFGKMQEIGIFKIIGGALTQAFFTLSLGIGSMAIFGSYVEKTHSLLGESVNVAALDTFVAICSGLIIFPACTAYGISVNSGPSLLFITLPNVFNNLPGGRVWGTLFFLFMEFAAFSTVLAVFENIVSMVMELTGASRKKVCYCLIPTMILLSLPCALGSNLLSWIQPMGAGSQVLDLEDFIVSNLLLPLGSLVVLLFCISKRGWGWDNYLKEVNTGDGIKVGAWMKPLCIYVLPIFVVIVFFMGIL